VEESQTQNLAAQQLETEGPLTALSEASLRPAAAPAQPNCPSCGAAQPAAQATPASTTWVYALGQIRSLDPTLALEKEVAQVKSTMNLAGVGEQEALRRVLQEHSYLARQKCWVFLVQGVDTYILLPRYPQDYSLLVETVRSAPSPTDIDLVIGARGPIANPKMCNGLQLPVVYFDQLYSFDRDTFMKAVPHSPNVDAVQFAAQVGEVFDRIMSQADNAGATDQDRALNYLAVRYPALYAQAAASLAANSPLTAVTVRPSPLSSTRNILDVIFAYTNRNSGVVEQHFVRVDVTEEFPFLVTKLLPYYDR
jgi:hypothetical protein